MPLIKFLKDKLGVISLSFLFMLLSSLVLWLTPSVNFNLEAFAYTCLLQLIALGIYLILNYSKKQKWLNSLKTYQDSLDFFSTHLQSGTTEEQKIAQTFINLLIDEHRHSLEEVINAQQEQKDFIDSWVHEIKVPLASVKLTHEALEESIPEKQYYQLENNTQKIENYVEQVLYYSRLDSFSKDYLIQETALKKVIIPIIRQNANYIIQKQLHYTIEGQDYEVLTDQKWLSFILNQIIGNAIKYTSADGKILLHLKENEVGVWLEITDTGIGIPPDEQGRIFDKGFTGQAGRNQTQHSTGLGLYLAKELAEKLGHHIFVESKVGKGTTISLLFPHLTYYADSQEEKII